MTGRRLRLARIAAALAPAVAVAGFFAATGCGKPPRRRRDPFLPEERTAAAQQPVAAPTRVIPDSQAGRYVGRIITVEGTVKLVSTWGVGNTAFLYFGPPVPNYTLAAVIFTSAASRFPNPEQWKGKHVRVTGAVRLFTGRPEIVLEDPAQLMLAP